MNKIFNRIKEYKNLEYILISIILLLGFIVRLYKINNPIADWHSWRQADTASVSRTYVERGVDLLYPRYHDISTTQTRFFNPEGYRYVEFPVLNAFHAVVAGTFPFFSLEIWARLTSVIASVISIYLIYLIGKILIDRKVGILSSFFYAFLPFNIYFTRVILPEPTAIMFALLSLWFFISYTRKDKIGTLYVSSIFFAFALLVKPFTIFYFVPILYLSYKKYGLYATCRRKEHLIALGIAILPFIFWRAWISQFPEGIPLWKWAFNGDGIRFKPSFWSWIFGERLGKLILGIWGLVPFSFGILAYRKGKAFVHLFLLGMFFYVAVFATVNVRHDYYQTITIPAISFALAQGSITMWNLRQFKKKLARPLLIFSILMMFIITARQVREFYKINRPEIMEAGSAIKRLTSPEDLVIAPYNGDTAFLYQTGRWGWPVVDRPIDELIENGADYYVSVDLNHPQTKEFSDRFTVIEKTEKYIVIKLK